MQRTRVYRVREANEGDLPELMVLGKQFANESGTSKRLKWNGSKFHIFLISALERSDFCVFCLTHNEEVVGMFIGFCTPAFFSNNSQAIEITWYVEPDLRGSVKAISMIDHYEDWAREAGAECATLVSIANENAPRVARLYNRKGYSLVENTFVKEL